MPDMSGCKVGGNASADNRGVGLVFVGQHCRVDCGNALNQDHPMVDDPDIWRAANLILKRHSADAETVAAMRAG